MIGLFLAGLFFFTFIEYVMHRYLYHIPATTPRKQKISYTMHGVHHDYPKDKSRLAMPPLLSLIIATVLFIIYRAVLGDYVFGFLAGFLIGYAAYLAVHYSVHAFKVPDNFLKYYGIIIVYTITESQTGLLESLLLYGTRSLEQCREKHLIVSVQLLEPV